MAIQLLDTAPKADDFTPLQEHQEQTPTTFFGAKPILYAHYSGLALSVPASQVQQDAAFAKFASKSEDQDLLVEHVDIWVNSENLVLFQTSPTPTGVAIPYPTIGLHATMKYKSAIDALYMNLSLNDLEEVNDEDDVQTLELTVLPPNHSSSPDVTCIKDIFSAMNTCADLHPDANASGNEEGDDILDETAPGASGWITAENMDQYLDDEGNFTGMVIGEELGPGAGTVRARDEADDGANGVNGVDGHEEKYHRTG